MKKFLLTFAALCIALLSTAATTFTFTSADDQTKDGISVVVAKAGGQSAPAYNEAYSQLRLYAKNTITVSGAGITKVELTFTQQGTKPYADLTAASGTLTSGGASTGTTDEKTDVWQGTANQVVFTLGATGQRVLCRMVVYTNGQGGGDEGGGDTPGGSDNTPSTDLDPAYNYLEPTAVTAQGEPGSNQTYAFVCNNIHVSCTTGAIVDNETAYYFGCNAENSLTFTATRPIKGIVISGYIKKDFEATVSSGTIEFADASEDAVEADVVLTVKDVNNTVLTLNCTKQLRCYQVLFYFEENPDAEVGDDNPGEYGDYNFDYEPTEVGTFNFAFDEGVYNDMQEELGYPCISLYLASEDFEAEIAIFATPIAGTILPVGTYPINSTYENGTVQASIGGDEYMDIPSYIATDFVYDEEYDEWYYNSAYYLESGSLVVESNPAGVSITLNATSHFGSTFQCTYVGALINASGEETPVENTEAAAPKAIKTLEHGQIIIHNNNVRYNVLGAQLR